MLVITLYKGVILDNSYRTVFSNGIPLHNPSNTKTWHELYLENLGVSNRKIIEIPNVYYENNGELIFDYEEIVNNVVESIYEFNYMKIEEYDEEKISMRLRRYCFIQAIRIKNGVVVISYDEDIWSSYISYITKMNKSLMTNSRFHDYRNTYMNFEIQQVEIPYDGNNELLITHEEITNPMVQIIVELQYYELVQQGEKQKARWVNFCKFFDNNSTTGIEITNRIFSYDTAINKIRNILMPSVSNAKLCWDGENTEYSMEIGKIYILPAGYDIPVNVSEIESGIFNGLWIKSNDISLNGCFFPITHEDFYQAKLLTIQNDYKNFGLGTLNNLYEIVNNGSDFSYSIFEQCDSFGFKLFLSFKNQIYDITNEFRIDVPFSVITSEELAQQKVAMSLKDEQYQHSKQQGLFGVVSSFFETILGAIGLSNAETWGSATKSAGTEIGGIGKFFSSLENMRHSRITNNLEHSKMYSNSKGTFSVDTHRLVCIYGILLFKINADNNDLVKNYINEFGYVVNKFVLDFRWLGIDDAINFESKNCNYNYIKFDDMKLYGEFPREIAEVLENIFNKGVKIIYSAYIGDDTYVI